MRYYFLNILFLLISVLLRGNNVPTISISKVTPEGGVTYNSILCIAEDELGFIWFGSNDGLFRFNTVDIKRYSHFQNDPKSIPTNRINHIYKDLTDNLWIATENGLCVYNRVEDNFNSLSTKDQFGNFIGKNIHSFFQDKDSIYWFADERGVGTINMETNKAFYLNIENKGEGVHLVSLDEKGTIWVFFDDGEIYFKTNGSNTFQYFSKVMPYSIRSVLIDDEHVWIAYISNGLLCLNKDGSQNTYYSSKEKGLNALPSDQVRCMIKDENGQIWVGTYNGIVILEDCKVTSIINENKYSELPNHSIWSMFIDSQKNTWIGTYQGGLCFHSKYNNSFFHYTQSAPMSSLSYNVVSSFVQTPDKKQLIIGTEDGNLNYFNPQTNKFTKVDVTYGTTNVGSVKSLEYDKNGTLWVGTYGYGVLYQEKAGKKFKSLPFPFETGIQALDMLATETGIWVSNYPLGIYFYDFRHKTFKEYKHNPLDINSISDDNVRQILEDKNGDIWFATRNGLNLLKQGSNDFIHYFHQENNPRSLSSNIIYSMLEDKDGYLWLGTNGQGLDRFDPKTGTAEHFTMRNGLPGNEIFSVLKDNNDLLWITTNQGLCMFNPKTKEVRPFVSANGIQNNRFNPNASIAGSNGELYFGGTNGFIRFMPQEMNTNLIPPTTTITQLFVNNKEILPEEKDGILDEIISKTKYLKLNYKQNSISFSFVSNNYIDSEKNIFKYRLLGFNNEWTETSFDRRATFTNVPPDNYIFEVKSANNDGIWNEVPTQLHIRIIPPLWKRWYAYLFYFILLVLLIVYLRNQILHRQKLKNEIAMGKIRSENEEHLHQMKLQFFTNISHEFRTPLTLIQGPVERMINSENLSESFLHQMSLVKNNTDRLLRLVNQFLDFRKIESGMVKLKPVNSDIVPFCKNVYSCFQEHAKHRSFDFTFNADITSLKMDFDPDKLDKILFNILSNAFKYSSDGGRISMNLSTSLNEDVNMYESTYAVGEPIEGESLIISISDSGKGITKDNISQIFDRFYQISHGNQQGTGIGLSLSKNYILLHKGWLSVKTLEGKGSVFSICLPQFQEGTLTRKQPGDSDLLYPVDFTLEQNSSINKNNLKDNTQNQEALILIVEDNIELLNYLGDLLQNHFRVSKARNGKEASAQVHSLFPDLIISDVMMPEMDGIELCGIVKNDIRTSHIPVILLTALDTVADRISGLHSGADAYISKPFNDDLLVVQVNNLLDSRKSLRESFGSEKEVWKDKFQGLEMDKKLILKAIAVVEENLSNFDFSVENLASNLNFSRTHLHRKLKSITNQSATEFIRNIRLKHAVKLMQKGNHKVNEIGYAVGFNSHNYFTKSFKKQYGKSPSDFIKENLERSDRQNI
jgi:signal transduction histidine kinase/ligand-binding sensor domain-containing protein/DNA-binding response OmpR family regulator